jgi:hypothetical protein
VNLKAEIIDLASEGYFYPSSSIYSSGKVSILPITGEVEELLANANLAKRGLLEDVFLNTIVDGSADKNELLQCDKESILLNTRIANYGSQTKMKASCSECDAEYEGNISFAFRSKPFNFLKCEKGNNRLVYTFPKCKKNVYFRLPTCSEYEIYKKHGWLAFAKKITISIDDVSDINNFYEYELSATDSKLFRKYFEENTPGYINKITLVCPTCNTSSTLNMDIDIDIFGIKPESKMNIHSEIFDLCYYSNGAFTQEGVYKMPTNMRSFYIKKLVDVKKAESDANKAASEGKGGGAKIAKPPSFKK